MEIELTKFRGQLQVAYEINHILPELLKEHYAQGAKSALEEYAKLNDGEKIEYQNTMKVLGEILKGDVNVIMQASAPSEKIRKMVFATMLAGETQLHIFTSTLRNMVLSYLISKFEDLIATYLKIIFTHKPEAMRSSKTLQHEEILKHDTIESLRAQILSKEIDAVLRESIEKINDYLKIKFGLDLSARPNWNKLTESVYRRNYIIHNDSLPNIDYMQRFKPTSKTTLLDVDEKYLDEIADVLNEEAEEMKKFLVKKFEIT